MSEASAPLYDPNEILANADKASEAGFSPMRFGRVSMTPKVLTWVAEGNVRVPKRSALAPHQALRQGESMELEFVVDIKEFSPNLNFDYTRSVTVRKSRKQGDRLIEPTDWDEIVLPSLIKTFGKDWAARLLTRPYVMVEETPNIAGRASKKSGKMYGTIRFVRAFKSRDECYAMFRETIPTGEQAADVVDTGNGSVPANILHDVQELVASNGVDAVRELLASKPFGNYEADALLAAAGITTS